MVLAAQGWMQQQQTPLPPWVGFVITVIGAGFLAADTFMSGSWQVQREAKADETALALKDTARKEQEVKQLAKAQEATGTIPAPDKDIIV